MGLAGPRKRTKISSDPNNTHWSRSTDRFGHRVLSSLGWTPGTVLGADPNSPHHTVASSAHVKVAVKDDNRGVGCTLVNAAADECTGLGDLQSLLGRLNGKSEDVLAKEEQERRKVMMKGRFGMRFVEGGVYVSSDLGELVKNMEIREVKKEEEAEAEGEVKIKVEEEEVEIKLEKGDAVRKQLKRKREDDGDEEEVEVKEEEEVEEGKKIERKSKKEKKKKKDKTSKSKDKSSKSKDKSLKSEGKPSKSQDDDEDRKRRKEEKRLKKLKKKEEKDRLKALKSSKKTKKKKKSQGGHDIDSSLDSNTSDSKPTSAPASQPSTPYVTAPPTPQAASGTSTPSSAATGRHVLRSKWIAQKRMSVMDPKALNEILMIKA